MRLTLRTLLAYMDDILDPQDQEELGRKIEASPFASELIHRSRDAVRRLRLSAPDVLATDTEDLHGGDGNLDANTVAEYLDNTLPPEQVAEFERSCLEAGAHADMLLAEVASCHHILTLVLGEPAEVDGDLRQRMYALGEHSGPPEGQVEPVDLSRAAVHEPIQSAAAVPLAPRSHTDPDEESMPDYMLAAMRARRRAQRRVALALLAAICGGLITYLAWPKEAKLPPELASGSMGNPDDLTRDFEIESNETESEAEQTTIVDLTEVGGEAPPFDPDAASDPLGDPVAGSNDGDDEDAVPPAADIGAAVPTELGPELAPPGGTEPADASAPTEDVDIDALPGSVTDNDAAAQDAPTVELPASAASEDAGPPPVPTPPVDQGIDPGQGVELDQDLETVGPDVTLPAASVDGSAQPPVSRIPSTTLEQPTIEPLPGATLPNNASANASSNDVPALDSAVGDAAAAAQAEPPRQLGAYLGNNDLLLRFDRNGNLWVRLPPRSAFTAGARLLVLPTFRTHVVLGSDVNAYLVGGAEVTLAAAGDFPGSVGADFALDVPYGRLVLNSGLNGNRIALKLGDHVRVVELAASSSLAIEVVRTFVPGSDPARDPAPLDVAWYLTSGKAQWGDPAAGQSAEGSATWTTIDGVDQSPQTIDQLPEWIDNDAISENERRARHDMAEALVAGQPVNLRLLELSDPAGLGRRTEVRSLAAKSGTYVGEFEPSVTALADSDAYMRAKRKEQVAALREALARTPDFAEQITEVFAVQRGQAAAEDLMEMLIGYNSTDVGVSREEVQNGALVRLIRWLDDDDLTYRVLASHNINEITGTSYLGGYRPEHTAGQRGRAIRIYWDRLEAGEIMPRPWTPRGWQPR